MKLNGSFFLLLQGLSITNVAMTVFGTACILWLVDTANSGSLVGLLVLVSGLPAGIMTLAGGVFADRHSRKSIIVLCDFFSGLMIASTSLVFYFSTNITVQISCLFLVQLVIGVMGGVSGPAFFSLLPNLLSKNDLAMGNAVFNACMFFSGILGRIIAGLAFGLWSMTSLLLIIGLGYFVSALTEQFIQEPVRDINKEGPSHQGENAWKKSTREIHQCLSYVFKNKAMMHAMALRSCCLSCVGIIMVTLPFIIENNFNGETKWFGYLMGFFAVGTWVGSMYAGLRFNRIEGINGRTMLYSLSLFFLPLLSTAFVFVGNIYISLLLVFLIGICSIGIPEVFVLTQLQSTVPKDLQGRMMAVFIMIGVFASVSALVSGVLIDVLNKNIILAQCILNILVGAILYPLLFNKSWMNFINIPATDK